jgi:hypothetical protein
LTWFTYHRVSTGEKQFQQKSFSIQDSTFCSHRKPCKATYLGYTKHSQARQPCKKDS